MTHAPGVPGARRAQPASAVLAVVVALLVLAALVSGLLLVATGEAGATGAYRESLHARLAAQSGLAATWSGWNPDVVARLPVGGIATDSGIATPDGRARFRTRTERLGGHLFIAYAMGEAGYARQWARAESALLVRTANVVELGALSNAAIAAAGPVHIGPSAVVDGETLQPPATTCPGGFPDATPPTPAHAVRAANVGDVVVEGGALVTGLVVADPTIVPDPRAPFATALQEGDPTQIADRVEMGAVVVMPVTGTEECVTSADGNWGDPLNNGSPCATYAPLIYAPGDLQIVAGTGQGIIVADGVVTIESGARFFGLVISVGGVELRGEVHGTVWVAAGALTSIEGLARFDRCAVTRALAHAPALARPVAASERQFLPAW